MHDSKENIDTLFGKAASLYPLKTSFDDWNLLAAKLAAPVSLEGKEDVGTAEQHAVRRWLLTVSVLMLFLLSGLPVSDVMIINWAGQQLSALPHDPAPGKSLQAGGSTGAVNKSREPQINPAGLSGPGNAARPAGGHEYVQPVSLAHSPVLQQPLAFHAVLSSRDIKMPVPPSLAVDSSLLHRNEIPARIIRRRVYWGVLAGIGANRVSNQDIKKPGYSTGIIAGKEFSGSLALETGITFNLQNYYTSGQHFSMSKIGTSMPSDMEIIYVNGRLYTLQFPVRIKYKFAQDRNNSYFITGGAISSLLCRESNDYMTMHNNVMKPDKGLYKENYFSFMSNVSFSIGIERVLSPRLTIRIEPYYSMPIRRTGMGNISMQQAGINFMLLFPKN